MNCCNTVALLTIPIFYYTYRTIYTQVHSRDVLRAVLRYDLRGRLPSARYNTDTMPSCEHKSRISTPRRPITRDKFYLYFKK